MDYIKKKGKVFIKALPRETTQNVHEFTNRGSKGLTKMDKTKIGRFAKDCFMATYNRSTGLLQTGLNQYFNNPFKAEKGKDKDPQLVLPNDFPQSLLTAEKVKLQHILEAEHGVPFNTYTDAAPTSGFKPNDKITFFQKFRFKLDDGSTPLNMAKVEDELAYYIILANPKQFAPSYEAWRKHQHPYATHYIFIEEEHQEREFSKKQLRNKALAYLEEFNTKSTQDLVTFCKAIKKNIGNITPQIAYTQLDDYITTVNNANESNAEKFIKIVERFKTTDGKAEINALALLQDLMFYKIVSGRQDIYTWLSTGTILGNREAEAVSFLANPTKKPEIDQMKAEMNQKMFK